MKIHVYEIICIEEVGNSGSGGRCRSIVKIQRSLQMRLEELCMPEGNANGMNANHLACVRVVHARGHCKLVECQSCGLWADSYLIGVLGPKGPEDVIVLVV
jgi:hypothetical protein